MKYYKFLTADNKGPYSSFDFTAYLPKGKRPGKWLPTEDLLALCMSGYHACLAGNLINWLQANLYEVELAGDIIQGDAKVVAQRMRFVRHIDTWNERSARLYACWCVRQIWRLVTDERSRTGVETAERYAEGAATREELDAAGAAARDVVRARDAAGAAAEAAAWVTAEAAAGDAVRYAARDAAGAAAWDAAAARAAAWALAWAKQKTHLDEILELPA
jgi:hypothetical protein